MYVDIYMFAITTWTCTCTCIATVWPCTKHLPVLKVKINALVFLHGVNVVHFKNSTIVGTTLMK